MPFKWKRKPAPKISREEKLRSRTEETAYQLYQNRLILQKGEDEKNDWELAQQIVQSPVKSTLFACHTRLIQLEKRTWEPLLVWANNQAFLSLLGLVGNVGIIVAVLTYIGSEKQRRDAEVLNAWQTITNAYGQAGSGGRIQALEFLNASPGANWRRKFPWFCAPLRPCVWPAENLAGINLAVDSPEKVVEESNNDSNDSNAITPRAAGVYLAEIQLPRAYLWDANLGGAYLLAANLEDAYLGEANLEGADLSSVNLEGAVLWDANLEDAYLSYANLEDAELGDANLEGAVLLYANLKGAVLWYANLEGAVLSYVNLEGAEGLDVEQVTQAKLCRTKLPSDIDLPPNRDCAELGIDPDTGAYVGRPDDN